MIFILWTLGIVCAVVFLVAGLHFHRTARGFVRNNAEGVKIALLVGAALYTALVYNREATDSRIANTLAFKERTESGELRKAFEAIDMMWIRSEVKWDLDRFRRQVANTRDCNERFRLHKKFAQFATELVESRELEDEIVVIHGFYKDINIPDCCINRCTLLCPVRKCSEWRTLRRTVHAQYALATIVDR